MMRDSEATGLGREQNVPSRRRRHPFVYERRNWKDGPAKPGAKKSAAERLPNPCARAINPPSTSIAAPVTHSDSSLARNNAMAAISSGWPARRIRSEEHTSELQSLAYLVCRLLLEKKKKKK